MDATTTPPVTDIRTPVDLNFEPRIVEKSFDYKGTEIKLHYYYPTRLMRNKALLEAVDAYRREHPGSKEGEGMGGDPTVFEKEMACRMIKWWNLPKPPRVMWDWLPVDIGEKIVESLEIEELFAFDVDKQDSSKVKLSSESELAKN